MFERCIYLLQEQDDEKVESPQASSLKEQVCFWYIMDEFGSKIRHSDLPTVSVRCFYYVDREVSYSVLFPIQDLDYGGNFFIKLMFFHFKKAGLLSTGLKIDALLPLSV